jgi:galactokinase
VSAAELFRRIAGREPDGVWSAPGRVNLIGEHTDYNDGFVLPFAIDRRTTAAVGTRTDGIVRVASALAPADAVVEVPIADLAGPAGDVASRVPRWALYPLGVIWAFGRDVAGHAGGLDIAIDSDVPVGAGLSSSAAIECSIAGAVNDLWALGNDRVALARIGRLAENEFVGAPTGILDQSASLLARADAALFLDCRTVEAELVPLTLSADGLSVLVIDTRVSHAHDSGGYRERRMACERGAWLLGVPALRDLNVGDLEHASELLDDVTFRRVRHVVTENARVLDTVALLRSTGPGAIGPLLDASHASMRGDFEISTPELDTAVEAARAAGALGARMTGGGFGGAAIALIESMRLDGVEATVRQAFRWNAFAEPDFFVVRPSDGAGRDA